MAITRVPRLKQVPRSGDSTARATSPEGLDAFHTETAAQPVEPSVPVIPFETKTERRSPWPLIGIGLVGVLAAGASLASNGGWQNITKLFAVAPKPASLTLSTTPAGATVTINGEAKGITPLSLSLAAGTYDVRLAVASGQERSLQVTLNEGQSVVQQIEWAAAAPAPVATSGSLQVQTDPPGQVVFVDDVRRGTSPLTIDGLAAGEHRLVVSSQSGSYRRAVTITPGETMNVVVAPHAPAVSAGFLRVTSPVLLQLRLRGDLIGNTESDQVMLPAGEHDIEMSNEGLGFSRTQRVSVAAGRTAEVRVAVPNGLMSINAVPWAEVWINGERLGETPIANISRPIGNYRVTFRHPQFGERQATVTVSARETARLGMDMRQPR